MGRFTRKRQSHIPKSIVLSLCIFVAVIFLFSGGLSTLSTDTKNRQRDSLEQALNRDIIYCYTVEGSYPESLDYLKEHYGLTYDEDLFYVDYRPLGENILPDVTILWKEAN